jgi:hypothetical protein
MNGNKCLLVIVKLDLSHSPPFPFLSFFFPTLKHSNGDFKKKKKLSETSVYLLYKLFQKIENFQPKKELHNYDM